MFSLFKITGYILFAIHVLLAFLLVFETYVEVPLWMNPVGRMHPMLLHLPIGLIFLIVLLWFFRKEFPENSFQKITKLTLAITALSAGTAALMGFFLSREAAYSGDLLTQHKWTGVALSAVCYALFHFYDRLTILHKHAYPAALGIISILVFFTGHLGSNLTHGEDFLFEAYQTIEVQQFTENDPLYTAVIYPILEAKCISCHNDNKIKGELNMSSVAKILKGGENGAIWVAGNAAESHFLQRANLPLDHKEHMPPKGKTQLTVSEIALLTAWVNSGAATDVATKKYPDSLLVKQLAVNALKASNLAANPVAAYEFDAASDADIASVNTPFCTVAPIANGSPALQADFYVNQRFERTSLENLLKVKEQVVFLNLSKMPVTDLDFATISQFVNLERLNLNGTDISGEKLSQLTSLKKLQSLAISNTSVGESGLTPLLKLPKLTEIFVWNTGLSSVDIAKLKELNPKITFEEGYIPSDDEKIRLNSPIVVNEERIIRGNSAVTLKHPLPNVEIRYTVDGSDPDSVTGQVYSKPIMINDYTVVKAIASKKGWFASDLMNGRFYKSGLEPLQSELLTEPNPKYQGKGAKTLSDGKMGDVLSFKDDSWLGYKENNFEASFSFAENKAPKSMAVSYLEHLTGQILPPTLISVSGSNDKKLWKKITDTIPVKPKAEDVNQNVGISVPLGNVGYKYYKVLIKNEKVMPKWHMAAGQPAWFFVDEVFFN